MKYFLSYLTVVTIIANSLLGTSAFAGTYRIQSRMYTPVEIVKNYSEQNPKHLNLKDLVLGLEKEFKTPVHLSIAKSINHRNAPLAMNLAVQNNTIILKSGNKLAKIEILNDDRVTLNGVQIYREDAEDSKVLLEKVQKILSNQKPDGKLSFSQIIFENLFPSAHAELGNNDLIGIGIGAATVLAGLLFWFFKKDDKTVTTNSNLNVNYKNTTPRRPYRYMANHPYAGYDIDEEDDFEPEAAAVIPTAVSAQ
jgi:hypothetical protein